VMFKSEELTPFLGVISLACSRYRAVFVGHVVCCSLEIPDNLENLDE
jgi:hypothetical protein